MKELLLVELSWWSIERWFCDALLFVFIEVNLALYFKQKEENQFYFSTRINDLSESKWDIKTGNILKGKQINIENVHKLTSVLLLKANIKTV